MKRQLLLVSLSAGAFISTLQGNDTTNKTFFVPQGVPFQSGRPERVSFFRNEVIECCEDGWGGGVEVVVFGGKSVQGEGLAKYFSIYEKTCLNVREFKQADPALTPDNTRGVDVEARNFNIETVNSNIDDDSTTFQSQICFCPKQDLIGVGIAWRQALWYHENGHAQFWFEGSLPVVRIRNTMGLTERVISTGGGAIDELGLDNAPRVGNMIEAFAQSNWNYGRILAGRCLEKWGVADIELKFGWNSLCGDTCHANSYIGLVVPTGNRPCSRFFFEPIVGNNHHWGVMYGSNVGFEWWRCRDHIISVEMDLNGRYLFRNKQTRIIGLQGKLWGQFLEMYSSLAEAQQAEAAGDANSGTSGVNVLGQCVKVSPRFSLDFNTALVYEHCNWLVEGGYNFYARHKELICLANKWDGAPQVKDIGGVGNTNTARTITNNYTGSFIDIADYQGITQSQLDLDAAAHPAVLANMIYASVGYKYDVCDYPTIWSFGGGYEFSSGNDELNRWQLWGKFVLAY